MHKHARAQGLTAKTGARELADTEVWMNRRARRSPRLSRVCAPFLGAFEVGDDAGAGGLARGATVLVWAHEVRDAMGPWLLR